MSFTVTNRSLIRFESAKEEDEWKRTLMFFNVDISGGVCCDRRNEITAPRTSDCNGKRRTPGGGLSNPITESAMSFGAPNKFYAHGHGDFDHGNYGRRTPGRRRDNSAYSDSPRHFHYRMIKPGRGRVETGLVSPSPSVDSAGYFENLRSYNHNPDFETEREYENYYPDESYESEKYDYHHRKNRKKEPYPESRYDYDYDYNSNASSSTQRQCQVPRTLHQRYYHYDEEPPKDDYNRAYRETLPCDLRTITERPKRNYEYRQASGSMPTEYASNYHTRKYREYEKENDYDGSYEPHKSYEKHFDNQSDHNFSDYDQPEYNDEIRKTPPPIPFSKPHSKYYKVKSSSHKDISDPSNYPTKIYKTEREYRFKDNNVPLYKKPKDRQPRYNRCKRYYQPEKMPPRKSCNHFKETREAPIKYDRISKDILRLAPPKKHEHQFNDQDDKFDLEQSSQRSSRNRYKIHDNVDQADPSTYKKYFKEEVPCRNFHNKINGDMRREERNLRTVPPRYFDKYSRGNDSQKTRKYRKSIANRKKSVDFVRLTDCNDGTEIPHRIRESSQTPSSVFFTIEIPYKKKERRYTYPPKSEHIPKRSDSGCETFARIFNSAPETFKPRTSLYNIVKDRKRKTMKQKISGFLKKSRICLTRSNIFGNKSKVLRNYKPVQRHLNCAHIDCRNNGNPDYIKSSPKTSNHSLESQNKRVPICCPSLGNASQRHNTRRGKVCHYPTVYRGKSNQLAENDDEIYHEYSMYNVFSTTNHQSKVNNDEYDHCGKAFSKRNSQYFRPNADLRTKNSKKVYNRVSSGNCSLWSGNKGGDPIETSEINVCLTIRATDVSLTGSPKIVSSKVVRDHGLSCKSNKDTIGLSRPPNLSVSRQFSGSTICGSDSSASRENQFKNVRFSPPPSVHNSCSSTTNSSKSSSSRTERPKDCSTRKSIEACSKPPTVISGRSSQNLFPRHRTSTKWSLTRHSMSCNSQHEFCNSWTPERLENNFSRPSRPGLFQSNTIEKCSRPPTLFQSDINKRSSLKGVNNSIERSAHKKVILKTNSSNSLVSGSVSGSESSTKSLGSCEKQDIQNFPKSECHRCQSHNFQFDEDRKIEVSPRRTRSWPSQSPRNIPSALIQKSFSKPEAAPKVPGKSSESTISKRSSSSLRDNNQGTTNMQLVCYPDPIPTSSGEPQSEYATSFTAMPSQDTTECSVRGDLCCPKLIEDWDKESLCRRSIVEELKRELLQSFRTDQQIESQAPFLRPTPHIMIFPCVPDAMIQSNPNLNPNLFCRPESVVCWTPCSKPQNPF
ncbi:hypothetical protein KR084_005606 [Drosophila pseudotakahashii]|nr:hypothetical protein KR084_005606 [Drosophila pseudotakahashii]